MGCHSGKVSAPESASAEGTLLASPSSPSKEATEVVEEASETATKEKAPVTMVVTNWGQVYTTHEGLARTLGVYDKGWVSQFNDLRDGDTGVLLAESTLPINAVALRLHRNGGVVLINRSGVEVAGFNGVWNILKLNEVWKSCEIRGDKLTLSDGTVSDIHIDELTRKISITFAGSARTAELRDDMICWDDGDVWTRQEGTPDRECPHPDAPLEPTGWCPPDATADADQMHHQPTRPADPDEGVLSDERLGLRRPDSGTFRPIGSEAFVKDGSPRRLSTVREAEESEASSSQPVAPVQTSTGVAPTHTPVHAASESSPVPVTGASQGVPEATSAQAAAQATADAKRRFIAGSMVDDSEKDGQKTRRERPGCCC